MKREKDNVIEMKDDSIVPFGCLDQREAELQRHWRVEHAEQKAYLKERLHQCKEDLIQGFLYYTLLVVPSNSSLSFLYYLLAFRGHNCTGKVGGFPS